MEGTSRPAVVCPHGRLADSGLSLFSRSPPPTQRLLVPRGHGGKAPARRENRLPELGSSRFLGKGAAGIKAALDLQGYEMSAPRRPSEPLGADEVAELRRRMAAAGLLG